MRIAILSAWILTSVSAYAETFIVKPQAGQVEFEAIGRPAMLKIKGQGTGPSGELSTQGDQVQGQLKFDLQTLDTGISMRDDHMKNKYLEVGKNPEAKLTLTKMQMPAAKDQKPSSVDVPFEGLLEMHGQKRPVKGTVTLNESGDGFDSEARFVVDLKDFAVDIPSYAGIKVAENVNVRVKFQAERAAK